MKNKNWFTWIAALFLFASTVHGRELAYQPEFAPVTKEHRTDYTPVIIFSSVLVVVLTVVFVDHKRRQKEKRELIKYHLYEGK